MEELKLFLIFTLIIIIIIFLLSKDVSKGTLFITLITQFLIISTTLHRISVDSNNKKKTLKSSKNDQPMAEFGANDNKEGFRIDLSDILPSKIIKPNKTNRPNVDDEFDFDIKTFGKKIPIDNTEKYPNKKRTYGEPRRVATTLLTKGYFTGILK